MNLNPYLFFNGNCAEAFRFYADTLGGQVEAVMNYGGSPGCEEIPADWHDKVMHACLAIGDNRLMGSDPPPQYHQPMQGVSVALAVDTPEEAERVFAAFSDGGEVQMPMEETFWAQRFGMVTDRFGVAWMVNCLKPCDDEDGGAARA